MRFREFLEIQILESCECKMEKIKELLDQMDVDDIDVLGHILYSEFVDDSEFDDDDSEFDDDDSEFDDKDFFTANDIIDLVDELGSDYHDEILDIMQVEIGELSSDSIEEALSILGRRKKSAAMKKNAKKLQRARKIKSRKSLLSKEELNKRARQMAVNILTNKWSKGRTDRATKEKIEDKLAASKGLIAKIAKNQKKIVVKNYKEKKAAERNTPTGVNIKQEQ